MNCQPITDNITTLLLPTPPHFKNKNQFGLGLSKGRKSQKWLIHIDVHLSKGWGDCSAKGGKCKVDGIWSQTVLCLSGVKNNTESSSSFPSFQNYYKHHQISFILTFKTSIFYWLILNIFAYFFMIANKINFLANIKMEIHDKIW